MIINDNPCQSEGNKNIGGTDYERKRTFQADIPYGGLYQHKKAKSIDVERPRCQRRVFKFEWDAKEPKQIPLAYG